MTGPSKSIIQWVPWLSTPNPQALYWSCVTVLTFILAAATALLFGTDPGDAVQIIIMLSVGSAAWQVWLAENKTPVRDRRP